MPRFFGAFFSQHVSQSSTQKYIRAAIFWKGNNPMLWQCQDFGSGCYCTRSHSSSKMGQINVYSWLGINWLNLTKKNNSILFLKCTFCFWTWHLLLQFTHYAIQQLMRDFKYLFWLSIDFLHCLDFYICSTGEILWRPVCYGLQPPSNHPESTEVETGTLL